MRHHAVVARLARAVLLLASLSSVGCTEPPAAGALLFENRGGPDLIVEVAGGPQVTVACNGAASIAPGPGGMPPLPWQVEVRRAGDGRVVLRQVVGELPQWFVQFGDEVVTPTLSARPISGPGGPPCP